ncbi:MAG: hypothetical protein U0132_18170 [Gemmatimonadaceae bacterium]
MIRNRSFVLLLLAAAACDRSPRLASGADTGLALARSGRAKDSLIAVKDSLLGERQRQLSEQSQLIGDAATSARLVSEIGRDLANVKLERAGSKAQPESSAPNTAEELATIQKKIKTVMARLNASQARVRKLRDDSTTFTARDEAQVAQLREYERSIADLRASVEQQRQQIAVLQTRVDSVTRANVALAARNDSVTARANALFAQDDSVFVAAGTESELIAKGVLSKEGGTKLMFGRGKTLVPSRNLDMNVFRLLSKSHDTSISLPRTDKDYRVVSRHDLAYTQLASAKDAKIHGELGITNPSKFWAASKFLILVER